MATDGSRIRHVYGTVVNVSPDSNWLMVQVECDSGVVGVGEATLDGHEPFVLDYLSALKTRLVGSSAAQVLELCRPVAGAPSNLVYASAMSGIEQALWDLLGKQHDVPVYALLGGKLRDRVPACANINRGTKKDRSPAGFAASAERAVEAGFHVVKCAPFDKVTAQQMLHRETRALIRTGIERVAAVRAAVGPDVDVLVDCHWRFDATGALPVIEQLQELQPLWIEAPVSEADIDGWARVRARTDARLAGGEMIVGLSGFRQFIDGSGVDVVMPDVKLVGGIAGLRKIAALAEAFGVDCSPHNPSGPVSTLASLHACAGIASSSILDYSWGQVTWRPELVGGAETLDDGDLVIPAGSGLGFDFNTTLAEKYPGQPVTLSNRPEPTGDARGPSPWPA